jgi:hypothetical protein
MIVKYLSTEYNIVINNKYLILFIYINKPKSDDHFVRTLA